MLLLDNLLILLYSPKYMACVFFFNLLCFNTVHALIFAGYKFSWFSWRVLSTNSSTHELTIFCMNYEGKYMYYGREFLNPMKVSILFNPRKLVPTKIKPSKVN